ncbi:MAG: F0F1 ATP synthase subunit epsilon [Eubacteriales bacterium]|nr:F0F1 ATP synthase subunit epsilon [Eubacteriales bacterium]
MTAIKKINLEIVTPYAILFNEAVDMVIMPARDGELGILPGHAVMMAAITSGELRIKRGDDWRLLAVSSGYAEIAQDMAIVIVNAAEWGDEIDVPRAEYAQDRAEKRMTAANTPAMERVHARHALERAKARLKVAEHYANSQKGHHP